MKKVIEIGKKINIDNNSIAEKIRRNSSAENCSIINIMGSPGSGKTSFILELMRTLDGIRCLVIEGDVDSTVDSDKIEGEGFDAVQIQTGGACHLDAYMLDKSIQKSYFKDYDLIIVENIGNLICTSTQDIGADLNTVLLSIPEGHDKPLKYPAIFKNSDAVIITKYDYLEFSDFDTDQFRLYVKALNEHSGIFITSSKKKTGFDDVGGYIRELLD